MGTTTLIILKLNEEGYAADSGDAYKKAEQDAMRTGQYPVVYPEPYNSIGCGYGPLADYVKRQCFELSNERRLDLEFCHQVELLITLYCGTQADYAEYTRMLGERLQGVKTWVLNAAELWPDYTLSSQKKIAMSWNWLNSAVEVSDDNDSLESASGDAPYILDKDDFGPETTWIFAEVPLANIVVVDCNETESERTKRLETIRAVPPDELCRPILELCKDRVIRVIDGSHRLEVAKERGQARVSALVKCCTSTLVELRNIATSFQGWPGYDDCNLSPQKKTTSFGM